MCCCGKPTINGEPGAYSWDGKSFSTRPVDPPPLEDGDVMLWDEPGRCGGLDCHSHHFRLVRANYYGLTLLVQHGGGTERVGLGVIFPRLLPSVDSLDSNGRFWLLHSLYSMHRDAERSAREATNASWRTAAAERRIKTRKVRAGVKVWIEPAAAPVARLESNTITV